MYEVASRRTVAENGKGFAVECEGNELGYYPNPVCIKSDAIYVAESEVYCLETVVFVSSVEELLSASFVTP